MKNYGARMEYAEERIRDLAGNYRDYLSECPHIRMPQAYEVIVNRPARRFYVSEKRATVVVHAMLRGDTLRSFRPLKREMFGEILRRVLELRARHPHLSIGACCGEVIEQPAPKFYLTAGSAKVMICKWKKRCFEEKRRKLRHLF